MSATMTDPYWANNPHNPANQQRAEQQRHELREQEMARSIKAMGENNTKSLAEYKSLYSKSSSPPINLRSSPSAPSSRAGVTPLAYPRATSASNLVGYSRIANSVIQLAHTSQPLLRSAPSRTSRRRTGRWLLVVLIAIWIGHELVNFGKTTPPDWFSHGDLSLPQRVGYIIVYFCRYVGAHPW